MFRLVVLPCFNLLCVGLTVSIYVMEVEVFFVLALTNRSGEGPRF